MTARQFHKLYKEIQYRYNPWKEQVIIVTTTGEMVKELTRSDKEFHLFCNGKEDVKGLDAIDQRVTEMINNGEVTNIYIDSL